MAKERREYSEARGYDESACHQGLPQHQAISRHEARVLDAEKNPEVKIFSTLASSVLKVPLEFKAAIGTMNKFAVDKAAKNLASVNSNNEKLYRLIANAEMEKVIAIKHKYDKVEAEYQNGGWRIFGEARENERLDLRSEVCVAGLKVKFAEVLGQAVRLARQVEDTTRRGGDVDLLAPPVAGSKSKFISTKMLDTAHDILADQGLRSASKIASFIVYGPVGYTINKVLEYPVDKIDQKIVQAKEKDDKHNAAVALERSRDFQKREYAGESIDCRLECLSQAMNSLNKASAVGSEPTTDFNAGSSISSLSSAGKKQRTPHVSP